MQAADAARLIKPVSVSPHPPSAVAVEEPSPSREAILAQQLEEARVVNSILMQVRHCLHSATMS